MKLYESRARTPETLQSQAEGLPGPFSRPDNRITSQSLCLEEQASLPAPLTQRGHSSASQSENGVPVHKTTPSNLPRPLMRLITQDLLQQAVVISMGLKGNPHSPDTGNTV